MDEVIEKTKTINYCRVFDASGKLIASDSTEKDSDSWLGRIKGKYPTGNFILSATDEGIVRAELMPGNTKRIVEAKKFPDTEPFVSTETRLVPGSEGIIAVNMKEIYLLKIQ